MPHLRAQSNTKYSRSHQTHSKPRSTVQVSLISEIPFISDLAEFQHICQKRSRTPEGAVLVACLALYRFAESPETGEVLLPHCLHPSFFVANPESGSLCFRPAEKEFLITHLYGKPERIRAYFRQDEVGVEGVRIEVRLDCFCGDPILFAELAEAERQQRSRVDKIERAGSRRNLTAGTKYERSLHVLMSRVQWREPIEQTPISELPIMIELRHCDGRKMWFVDDDTDDA